jgi:hypothetical protein
MDELKTENLKREMMDMLSDNATTLFTAGEITEEKYLEYMKEIEEIEHMSDEEFRSFVMGG